MRSSFYRIASPSHSISLGSNPSQPHRDAPSQRQKRRAQKPTLEKALARTRSAQKRRQIQQLEAGRTFTGFAGDEIAMPPPQRKVPKTISMAHSGLLELFELTEYHEDSPEVQRVKRFAISNQAEIQRVLAIWCADYHSGIKVVNKLAKALGHPAQLLRRVGPRGAQVKIWGWSEQAYANRVVTQAGLQKKWDELVLKLEPVASSSKRRLNMDFKDLG